MVLSDADPSTTDGRTPVHGVALHRVLRPDSGGLRIPADGRPTPVDHLPDGVAATGREPGVPLSLILRDRKANLNEERLRTIIVLRDEYEGYFRQLIDQGVASGEFRFVNTKIVTFAIMGMIEEFDAWYDPDGDLTADQIADIFHDFCYASLTNQASTAARPTAEVVLANGRSPTPARRSARRADQGSSRNANT